MRGLRGDRSDVPLVRRGFFLGRGTSVDPPMAVIADVYIGSHVHFRFIHVVNHGDVAHRTVVKKVSAVPATAFKSMAEVAEAVVDPAVKTYRRAPVAVVKN